MHILHIITGLSCGGAEGVLFRLVSASGQQNNHHYVISLTGLGVHGEKLLMAGIKVYPLNMPRGWRAVAGFLKIFRIIRKIKPDVVQTWMYHADLIGGIAAKMAGVRNVIWGVRGPFDREMTSWKTKVVVRLCASISRIVPKSIICNSKYATLVHINEGYPRSKFINIPNGISLGTGIKKPSVRAQVISQNKLQKDVILLGMIARYDPHKDHDNLLNALGHLIKKDNRITCLLIGSGMDAANRELCALLGKYNVSDSVRLLGQREDIFKLMSAIDIHVLSSAAESFPNVLVESMACCTPCVSTNVGDAALIIGDTGWVVPPSDPISLAVALQKAIGHMKDIKQWNIRGRACRRRIINNYSLEPMVKSYDRAWRNAFHGK